MQEDMLSIHIKCIRYQCFHFSLKVFDWPELENAFDAPNTIMTVNPSSSPPQPTPSSLTASSSSLTASPSSSSRLKAFKKKKTT